MATNLVVPELGESIVEATVLRWYKNAGDPVNAGETLVELETEKVNLDVSAPSAGVLATITHPAGDDVKIGDVLGTIEPASANAAAPTQPAETPQAAAPQPKAAPAQTKSAPTKTETPQPAAPAKSAKATPVAQRIADQAGVDLNQVAAGSSDKVTKQDVAAYLQKQKTAPALETKTPPPAAPAASQPVPSRDGRTSEREKRVRMSRRRQTIARRLLEAQQTAAMLTTFNEVDMSAVMDIRKQHKESFKLKYGVGLGLTSFFVKAVLGALKDFPLVNAEIQGDEIVYKHYYDIGIAVGASEGLVVPVLRDADQMTFAEIEKKISDFAQKAQDNTLALDDLRGGTFTITNGGVFGSLLSTPILNPPQVAILGLHKIEERPIALNGQVVIRPMMYIALSYDHRLIDGREAVQFLVRIKERIQDPTTLLLES